MKDMGRREVLTINVLSLIAFDGAHRQLAIRGSGSTIATRKVIDNKTKYVAARNTFKSRLDACNIGDSITIWYV